MLSVDSASVGPHHGIMGPPKQKNSREAQLCSAFLSLTKRFLAKYSCYCLISSFHTTHEITDYGRWGNHLHSMTENQPLTVKYLDTAEACMETYRKKQTLCHMGNFQISLIYAFIWCPLSVIKMCNTHKDLRIIQGKRYQNTVVSVLLLQFFFHSINLHVS